jgi:nucleoside-diphosphate-sugar epimerase
MPFTGSGIDYILHQGALASVPRSVKDPLTSHESNINGTLNLLIAARDARVRRIVYAASSSAYGDQPTQPKQEDTSPLPLSPLRLVFQAGPSLTTDDWSFGSRSRMTIR